MKIIKYTIILLSLIIAFNLFTISARAATDKIPLEPIIQVYCWEVGFEFDLSPTLLMSLVYQETRGNRSNLTQITNLKWFQEGIEYCNADKPKENDYQNIRICGYYIRKWFEEQGDQDPYLIMEMWNEGPDVALATHGNNPSLYAREIVNRAIEWQELWDKYNEP